MTKMIFNWEKNFLNEMNERNALSPFFGSIPCTGQTVGKCFIGLEALVDPRHDFPASWCVEWTVFFIVPSSSFSTHIQLVVLVVSSLQTTLSSCPKYVHTKRGRLGPRAYKTLWEALPSSRVNLISEERSA